MSEPRYTFDAFGWWRFKCADLAKQVKPPRFDYQIWDGFCEFAVALILQVGDILTIPLIPIWAPLCALWFTKRAIAQKLIFRKLSDEKIGQWKLRQPIGRFIKEATDDQ